ncbi:MAG: sodium/proton antiporter NhaB [Gammaproteobacteria bacterium]|nr:sodium/proton antiporter NhaB [Gammaproteobacteria bacterium]
MSRSTSVTAAAATSFLGHAPRWYALAVVGLLAFNVPLYGLAGPVTTAWVILAEFIFTLAMALKCHPLAPAGLVALEAVLLGLATPEQVYRETLHGFPVILLLVFMVTAIYFMRELLLDLFSRVLTRVRSPVLLAFLFCAVAALLSAFLDALTVLAVIITVAAGFYRVYFRVAAGLAGANDGEVEGESGIPPERLPELGRFRAALRGLLMHAAVGTALGGVCTLVGEPQNLLIGHAMGWDFRAFFAAMAPVSMPVLGAGLFTCVVLERLRWFGFGEPIPAGVRRVLVEFERTEAARRTPRDRWRLFVQGLCALVLVAALALHVAEVGLIGLMVVVLLAALDGISEEHRLAEGFKAAMPFTALLVVFFAIVAVIDAQSLFTPVLGQVLALSGRAQLGALYLVNGILSAVSDNVFVATIYLAEVQRAFEAGTVTRGQFEALAVAINTGTNIPSVATPNGQAAFLFLLTSSVAPLIGLSYGRMVWMALPYFVVMTLVGLVSVMTLTG